MSHREGLENLARITVFSPGRDEFDRDRVAHFSVRMTKKGKPDLRDVKSMLGDEYKVPLKYTSGGIRVMNPDIGWPPEVLWYGDPPEEFPIGLELRETLLAEHPSKLTFEERETMGRIGSLMIKGKATEGEIAEYTRIRQDLHSRPINLDKW